MSLGYTYLCWLIAPAFVWCGPGQFNCDFFFFLLFVVEWSRISKSYNYRDCPFIYSTTMHYSQWVNYTRWKMKHSQGPPMPLSSCLHYISLQSFCSYYVSLLAVLQWQKFVPFSWKVLFQHNCMPGFLLSFSALWSNAIVLATHSFTNSIPPYDNFIFSPTALIIISKIILKKQYYLLSLFSLICLSSWKQASKTWIFVLITIMFLVLGTVPNHSRYTHE